MDTKKNLKVYGVDLTKKSLLDFLKNNGYNLKIGKIRGFSKLYNPKRKDVYLEFDLTAPKTELYPGCYVDELTLYLHDIIEHIKTYNIAQFDRRCWWKYKNPYLLHD